MNNPTKYASTVPGLNDAEGMKEFWRKCKAMCLSSMPYTTEESVSTIYLATISFNKHDRYIMTYFTVVAASQCIQGPGLLLYPRAKEIKDMVNCEV